MNKIIITGGLGFIGSEAIRQSVYRGFEVLNIDAKKYSANTYNIHSVKSSPQYKFVKLDLLDKEKLQEVILEYAPDAILHFAAESHVDNSINNPLEFIKSNIEGTFNLLEGAKNYFYLKKKSINNFNFIHISTDEVFGSLGDNGIFNEKTCYDPQSPYSASKASSDHLVRAWHNTYELPIKITNCSNNYGPYQHSEKFIPVIIRNAIRNENIPLYGSGKNIRDWLHVSDHVNAIFEVLTKGKNGETYLIGGNNEISNIDLARKICQIIDKKMPFKHSRERLIRMVEDRKGHDYRYAIDNSKIKNNIGWKPKIKFQQGITNTIDWYIENYKKYL